MPWLLDLLDNWSVDVTSIGQDRLGLLAQVVAHRCEHRGQFIIIGRALANVGSQHQLTTIGIDGELGIVSLGKGLVFTLTQDTAVGIGQIALAFRIGPAGRRRFGLVTTPVIVLPLLLLLFILGYFGRKLLSVAFFQLLPCGFLLGFKRLALSDLLWQPGRIHFPLAIGSLGFA